MKKDNIFSEKTNTIHDFEFNQKVADVFDDMINRSVPFYKEQQIIIRSIVNRFFHPDTCIYDLGCSTATTLIDLCRDIKQPATFIGYDNSQPMLEKARKKIEENKLSDYIKLDYLDLNKQCSEIILDNASVVMMLWTLQFVRPQLRETLVKKIYQSLPKGGAFIVAEKILLNDKRINRFLIDIYYDYKRQKDYTDEEIVHKREALENVLIPLSIEENIELFKKCSFECIDTFFQSYNFAAFLCVKTD